MIFQDLQLSLAYRYGETAIPTKPTTNRKYWLNRGQEYCAQKLNLTTSATVTVTSGEGTLPTDFIYPETVLSSDNVELMKVAADEFSRWEGLVYAVTGNAKDGYTIKTKDDGDYTVHYKFKPTDMTSNDDECIIPDGEAVAAYAYAMLRKSETDPLGDAETNLKECDMRIDNMIGDRKMNDKELKMTFLQ